MGIWRNGRRYGLKIRWFAKVVRVQVPLSPFWFLLYKKKVGGCSYSYSYSCFATTTAHFYFLSGLVCLIAKLPLPSRPLCFGLDRLGFASQNHHYPPCVQGYRRPLSCTFFRRASTFAPRSPVASLRRSRPALRARPRWPARPSRARVAKPDRRSRAKVKQTLQILLIKYYFNYLIIIITKKKLCYN